jgi:serine/threonine protein kinase/WD40 repeat protein
MPSHSISCVTRRLRLSLEDRLTEGEQADLADHLEGCEPCRRELERLAARSGLWGDALQLRGELEPGKAPTIGLVTEEEPEDDEPDEAWLAFLDPPDPDRPGTLGRVAAYEVLEVLGRGGMGIVLKARDPSLERTVAIKVLTPALAHGPLARRRFAREARAAAAVGHEHIVAIYAVDEFRGLPYLVMQYIPGRSLQDRLDASGPLEVKEILRIGTQAARALAAAHAQGVVHRDIKPANILLENCVERVKLTDFGLARAMDDASLTQSGVIAGTPQYMAPEQARGEPVDARSDLFSLGVVLYAMAIGRPPFRANSAMAVLKRVCDDRHRPIRELNSDVPDWLESIIDRLLAKDPADRFQTAAEVAELLERGLAHVQQPTAVPRPVVGGVHVQSSPEFEFDMPVSKALPSRRRLATAAGFLMLSLVGLGASEAAGLTKVSEFVSTILRIKTAEGTLEVKVDDPDVKVDVDNECVIIGGAGPREIRLRTGQHRLLATRNGQPVKDELVSIMKGKKQIVSIGFDPHVVAAVPPTPADRIMTAPASHTEQCMVCHKGPVALGRPLPANHPELGTSRSGSSSKTPNPNPLPVADPMRTRALVWSLAFTPGSHLLAIGQQGIDGRPSTLRMWDLAARKDRLGLAHPAGYRCVAVSPDGTHLAAGTFDGTLQIFDLAGELNFTVQAETLGSPVNAVCFVDDGKAVATGSWDGKVRFTNVVPGPQRPTLSRPGRIFALAASPDGKTLAMVGDEGVIHVYDVPTGRQVASLQGHGNAVESLDFSPDGKLLASAGDLTVRIWDTATWHDTGNPIHHPSRMLCVRFSPDGKLLAISDGNSEICHDVVLSCSVVLRDVATRTELRKLEGHTNSIFALAFSPDGKTLASGSMDQTVKLWDTATGQLRETIVPGETGTSLGMGVGNVFGRRLRDFNRSYTKSLKEQYDRFIKTKQAELEEKKAMLIALVADSKIESQKPNARAKADDDELPKPMFDSLSIDQYRQTNDQLLQTEMDLMDARSLLQSRLAESQGTSDIPQHEIKKQTDERIVEEFRRDPQVAAIIEQIKATTVELDYSKSIARREADPALIAARKRLANLTAEYNDLWNIRSERIRRKVSGESVLVLRRKIEELEAKKNNLLQMLAKYDLQKSSAASDTLKAKFLREGIISLTGIIRTVQQKLEQIEFESMQDIADLSALNGQNPQPQLAAGPVAGMGPRIGPGESGTSLVPGTLGAIGSVSAPGPAIPQTGPLTPTTKRDSKLKLVDEIYRKTAELLEAQSRLLSKLTENQTIEEFRRDPQAAAVLEQIKGLRKALVESNSNARREADPALLAARKRLAKLNETYNDLWSTHNERLSLAPIKPSERLGLAPIKPDDAVPLQNLIKLRDEVEALKQKREELDRLRDQFRVLEEDRIPIRPDPHP